MCSDLDNKDCSSTESSNHQVTIPSQESSIYLNYLLIECKISGPSRDI